ncbi:MAG: hypothetical protein EPN17_09820 [Methylobacter sp.]|nr:MAG: hypothetical protein EPN17_09820 [Methylobacter sp.]
MIKISFKANKLDKCSFFNTDINLHLGESFNLPGEANCKLLSGFEKGIDTVSVISFILENINSVSLGLLSAYIYDQLKPQKIEKIEINGKEIPLEKSAIEEELAKYKISDKDDGH